MIRYVNIDLTWTKALFAVLAAWICIGRAGAQQVEYSQQQISIRNTGYSDGVRRAGESGILFTAEIKFGYPTRQVKGALDGQNPKEYHFFLELLDLNGNRVFYPSAIPDRLKRSLTRDEYVLLTANQTDWQYLRIFIPYNRIHLPEGTHRVKMNVNACNNDGTFYFRYIHSEMVSVSQPPIYVAKVAVQHIRILEKQYDMPGKKIPIIGLFLGGDKSKSGQGLPDAGWKVRVGGDIVFESEVLNNSYDVPPGTASFRIAKGDPVEFLVIDEDFFKSDEVLGAVRFELEKESGKIEKKGYAFGGLENGDFFYQQTKEPKLNGIVISGERKQYQGVTGLEVKVKYNLAELVPGDAVAMRPLFRDSLGRLSVPEFMKLVDVHMELGKSGLLVESQNGADEQTFFIPHYSVTEGMFPGIEFSMDGYDIPMQSAFAKDIVPIAGTHVRDVKVTAGPPEEASYKGYWGLKIPLRIDVPEMYYDDIDFTQLIHSIVVENNQGIDITDSILIITLKEESSLRNFQLRKINKDKILFLPYARCFTNNDPGEFTIQYKGRYWKRGILIGDEVMKYKVESPSLLKIPPFRVSYRLKKKNIEYTYYKVLHGNREIFRSEKVKQQKIANILDFSSSRFCAYDDITVEVIGIDYFGQEKPVYSYVFTPYLLARNVFPPYDTPKGVKGFRITRKKKK